jgi:hypothetical protein
MRHMVDRNGTCWECSDLGLPVYVHSEQESSDATPRVVVTATANGERRTFLAPLVWERSWSDDELLEGIESCAPSGASWQSMPSRRNQSHH